jgi:hypothetical protein
MTTKKTIGTAPSNTEPSAPRDWMTTTHAAQELDMPVRTLRRMIVDCKPAADGTRVCPFGIARKVGNQWRVRLGPAWRRPTDPSTSSSPDMTT